MYKNYFYLLRCIKEISSVINGNSIIEIYTQEKDKLYLHIPLQNKPLFHLIISVNPQTFYLTFKEELHKAKKNTYSFFPEYLPSRIENIKIALGERIIRIEIEKGKLFFICRGNESNILFIDNTGKINPFKKITEKFESEMNDILNQTEFINSSESLTSLLSQVDFDKTGKNLPCLGKEIINETIYRKGNPHENLPIVIKTILNDNIAVYSDDSKGKARFHPESFLTFIKPIDCQYYDSYIIALGKYFSTEFKKSRIINVRKELEKYLEINIEKTSNKLNNLMSRIKSGSKEVLYQQYGNNLISNINKLKNGLREIDLVDYDSGTNIKIPLDFKLSPQQNIKNCFDKARSEKIELEKSKELYAENKKEYEKLILNREKLLLAKDDDELLQIKKELKLKPKQSLPEERSQTSLYRHFIIDGKYNVYVGKDSKNNDTLTTRFAKQNDYWFHARSVSGSHVVLRVENTKEPIPKNILQKAASLAAFYSKSKSSKLAPVSYTLKKYVTKNKNHDPGQVSLSKENVLLVRPEISKDCLMVQDA
jgi:predicted ribosome quality control (RQC) complex YloA/Tae2 family protein